MKIKRPAPNIFLLISMFLISLVQKRLINLKKDCFAFVSINNLLKMRGIVLLILSLVFTNSVKAQNPYVEIVSPTPNQIVDSNLNIQVILTYNNQYYPNNQVAGITANVSGRVLSLTYNAQNMNYEGTLSIAGLVQDTLTLTVNVSDTQGDKDTVSLKFIYDLPPVLVVYEPMDFTVANPYLNIKAKCINKDSCTLNVSMGTSENSAYSNNFNDSTNTSIDLSLGEGNYGDLIFYATDKFGLTSQQIYRKIFVESSPYLTKVFEANDKIVDFNYNKVLVSTDDVGYSSHNNAINLSRIVDIQTGDSVNIPVTNYIREGFGNLTPFGAIFLGSTVYSIGDGDSIFDWNSGSLLPVDAVNSSYGILQTNGNYSIWLHSNQLMFRSLISKTNSIISFAGSSYSINTTMGSVLADGTVIYASNYNVANQQSFPYYNILKYKNGNTTVVSSDTTVDASRPYNEYDGSPSSDGNNILYDHYFLSYTDSVSNSLYLYNGKKDTLLSNLGNLFQGGLQIPHQQYQANNNFLVFPNVDSLGTTQLWMKDNLDNYYQITSVPPGQGPYSTVQLDLLNNKGDLIFSGYDLLQPYGLSVRYFETKKQIQEICSAEIIVTSNSSVSITATNISGGGNNPQYAFASDRAFINILQQSSNDNILTLQPSSFNIGDNWIYVMMKTSDSCYTNQTVVDSIKIIKNNNNSIGIIDPDFPNQVISANPNPFTGKFTITGLNISKNYVIILNNILGQQVLQKIISNQNTTDINTYFSAKNILELKLYDQRKNKLIGIIKLLSN